MFSKLILSEGLRPWMAEIKRAAAQFANKNCAKKTRFYKHAVQVAFYGGTAR
ncbi:MAG TPA: hypothetical protein QF468_05115 [Nitrospinota bacterium]|jgi:hypothetical protein|nr:hypothetical protein [Nitrospinota bacterium]